MAVFTGVLIATILGVILIPMLFVLVEKLSGAGHKAPAPERPAGVPGGGGH